MNDTATIAAPAPELTAEQVVESARALRARLLEDQAATEERGTYSEEMHEEFKAAGFYRLLLPKSLGGYEFDFATYVKVVMEIARGNPGAAWCLALASAHSVPLASWFPGEVQREVVEANDHFAAPTRAVPRGTIERVDGGWKVDGTWDYCSGSPYSTHALFWARVVGAGAQPGEIKLALVPRADWTLLDDWRGRALGMRGSGSNSIRVDGAIVPDRFVIDDPYFFSANPKTPGYLLHGNAMYAVDPGMFGPLEINAVLVGTARAALDEYERILRTKNAPAGVQGPSGNTLAITLSETADFQRWYGIASAKVDAAERLLILAAERLLEVTREAVESDGGIGWQTVTGFNLLRHQSLELGWQAVDLMFRTSGTSEGGNLGTRMNRYYRDYSMGRTNIFADEEKFASDFGKSYFEG